MTTLSAPATTTACAGCLGSTRCWVCTGRGTLVRRDGSLRTCPSCAGRTRCQLCRPAAALRAAG